ncbi:MAG: thioredoxin family protein [Alphaproteobacteria bacterium]|nr:thioredoxin family protein [Alphaproteobacteria bacterium]
MTEIVDLNAGKTFEDTVLNKKGPVLTVFYMEGCVGYVTYKPVLEALARDLAGSPMGQQVSIVMVNVLTNPELTKKLRIRSVPDTQLFKNGERVYRWGRAASLEELKKKLGQIMLGKLPARPAITPGRVVEAQQRFLKSQGPIAQPA